MADYLVLNNATLFNVAKRKMNANFLRIRSDWQARRGWGKALHNKDGDDIIPDGLSDDSLLDAANIVMFGERGGTANMDDGFTLAYITEPRIRLDGSYIIPLPDDKATRTLLVSGCPTPSNIETYNSNWFAVEETP